jgi:hypothetical protein
MTKTRKLYLLVASALLLLLLTLLDVIWEGSVVSSSLKQASVLKVDSEIDNMMVSEKVARGEVSVIPNVADDTTQNNTTGPVLVPVLVILVGPPKTATTTLQVYLSDPKTQAALKKDHYLYQGRFYNKVPASKLLHTLMNRGCKQATERAREKEEQAMPRCWKISLASWIVSIRLDKTLFLWRKVCRMQALTFHHSSRLQRSGKLLLSLPTASFGAGYRVLRISVKRPHDRVLRIMV